MDNPKTTGFFFEVEGAQVVDVSLNWDYTDYRMVEKLVKTKTLEESLHLVWNTGGGNPFSQQLCFVQGIEELAQLIVPIRAKYIRIIISELERIYGHFLWLGVLGDECGFESLMDLVSRDQLLIMKLFETFLDLKDGYIINTIGGVSQDILYTPKVIDKITTGLGVLEDRLAIYETQLLDDKKFGYRFKDIGVLESNLAIELGATGPIARATGIPRDIRHDDVYAAYETIDFGIGHSEYGDVLSRIEVIIQEVYEASHIVRSALSTIPDGEIQNPRPDWIEPGETLSRTETSQGEILQYIRFTSNKVSHLKIRPPKIANLSSLIEMLKQCSISDLSVIIASVDPYFYGVDHITLKDITNGKTRIYNRGDLKL